MMDPRRLATLPATAALLVGGCKDDPSPTAGVETPAAADKAPRTDGPAAAKQAIGDDGALNFHADDRCPVCAMYPKKTSKFASGIALDDGRTFYTCGTGCLIRSWLHPEVYLGAGDAKVERAIVPDYFAGRPIDATKAHWVGGSDVVGPMGPALVPLASKGDADTFVERHGGKHRFQLSEVDDARWQEITGKPAVKPSRMRN